VDLDATILAVVVALVGIIVRVLRIRGPATNAVLEDFGVDGWVGALSRGNDKMKRLQKVARGGTLSNESAWDSLIDLAVYAVIAAVLFDEARDPAEQELG
jgi:hypothetical protein